MKIFHIVLIYFFQYLINLLLALAAMALISTEAAFAHGIAGNRYFPATSTIDDPATADELSITSFRFNGVNAQSLERDSATSISGARLLSTNWAIGFDYEKSSTKQLGNTNLDARSNDVYLKGLLSRDDLNESLVSASLGYGYIHKDISGLGVSPHYSLLPSITFGKGFGNLGESWAWARPLAIVGAIAADVPLQRSANINSVSTGNQDFVNSQALNSNSIHWGFAVEYSTLFLTNRFKYGLLPDEEPLHQFVPLVEFAFDSSPAIKTTGTMNPGLSYVEQTWQLTGEAVIPLNQGQSKVTGFRVQLIFFLDDLIPTLFEKPLFIH